jgi:hypothetical protein
VGDLNGDGRTDLVTGEVSGVAGAVETILSMGGGAFSSPQPYTVGHGINDVTVADLDSDGKVDVGAADPATPGGLFALWNRGDGVLVNPSPVVSPLGDSFVIAADLTGGGIPQLIGAGRGEMAINIYPFKVGRRYGVATSVPFSCEVVNSVPADFDSDGYPDLAVATYCGVKLLINHGDGTFAAPITYADQAQIWAVAAADLDGDGRLDVVASDEVSGTLYVILNDSK